MIIHNEDAHREMEAVCRRVKLMKHAGLLEKAEAAEDALDSIVEVLEYLVREVGE